MHKYCLECGFPLQPAFKFCGECGTPIPANTSAPAPTQVFHINSTNKLPEKSSTPLG